MNQQDALAIPIKAMHIKKNKFDIFPYAIAAPALILLMLGMLYPMLWSFFYSFTDKRVAMEASFVGFENYQYIFNDPVYIKSIFNTVIFTAGSMALKVVLGVLIALLLNMNLKFRNTLRTLFLLPWTLPSVVAIYTWMWMYTGNGGLINNLLLQWGVIAQPIGWLSDPSLSIFSLILVNVWRGVPFIALSVLSGLQTIPEELYESAAIDGAGTMTTFWNITFPMIKPVILVSTLISTIWTINDFETVWLLTGGGPGQSTYTIPIAAFKYAFDAAFGHIGRACAAALTTVPVLLVLMMPVLNNMLGDDEKMKRKQVRREKKAQRQLKKEQGKVARA